MQHVTRYQSSNPGHWLPAACMLLSCGVANAADFGAYLVLTSDYVFRGVTYSDGDPAAQLGADLAFENGIYLGAWASTVDIVNGAVSERDLQVNYYLGYDYPINSTWSTGLNVVAYTFPGSTGVIDYDYVEYTLNVNYRDRAWFEYAYSPDLFHSGESSQNAAVFTEWPLPGQFSASAGFGYYDVSNLSGSGYTYWELGVSRPFGRLLFDLRYHDASRWVPIVSGPDRVDARLVISAKIDF